ncbi:MerC domain-containing protein [Agaribacter marinus]|uniref:MerC mercury resistance protein n=1 Tax=Agaribacter marinus TaxID=1431249 RepID=A0AA37WIV9_9ALTE|nr:MerC domain-containing protein [Agaribacter marinus]GLR71582.1 hypothetical protein GCM10007852_24900 [Agaribacter marinus]
MPDTATDIADKSAIALSGLCIVHCILPILLSLILPYFAGLSYLTDEAFHLWLIIFVVPLSLFTISWGYRQHRNKKTLILALIGLMLIIVSAAIGHDTFGHTAEVLISIAGSTLIVWGHLKNMKLRNTKFKNGRLSAVS